MIEEEDEAGDNKADTAFAGEIVKKKKEHYKKSSRTINNRKKEKRASRNDWEDGEDRHGF